MNRTFCSFFLTITAAQNGIQQTTVSKSIKYFIGRNCGLCYKKGMKICVSQRKDIFDLPEYMNEYSVLKFLAHSSCSPWL